jgi:hypothetical protein
MKNRILSLMVVLTLSLLRGYVSAQDQAPAPSFKEGDTWQFKITRLGGAENVTSTEFNDGTYELVFTQGKVKLYSVEGNQKTEMMIQSTGSTQGLLTNVGQSEQRPDMKFPLSVGQNWKYTYRETPTGARREINYYVEISVTGIEQVTTPAGAFKAFKVLKTTSWASGGGTSNSNTATFFYSPETRSKIKSTITNEKWGPVSATELIKFTPGN